jgi:hypothetical protein
MAAAAVATAGSGTSTDLLHPSMLAELEAKVSQFSVGHRAIETRNMARFGGLFDPIVVKSATLTILERRC